MIDVHCHLDLLKNIDEIIERAKEKGVKKIITAGVNKETNRKALQESEKYEKVKCMLGLYPIDALKLSDKEIDEEINFIRKNKDKIIGIGEVGMDFKEDTENKERQEKIFRKFVSLSIELNKPILIHSRKAEKECIEILEEMKAKKVIMHCFFGNFKLVERIVKNGWKLSIPTCVETSEHFQKVISDYGIENFLCETDSPFLHPEKKGHNEPANVVYSYKKIAEIKKMSLKDVEKQVDDNFVYLVVSR